MVTQSSKQSQNNIIKSQSVTFTIAVYVKERKEFKN